MLGQAVAARGGTGRRRGRQGARGPGCQGARGAPGGRQGGTGRHKAGLKPLAAQSKWRLQSKLPIGEVGGATGWGGVSF